MSEVSQPRTWRRRVHAILDGGIGGDPVATAVNVGLIVLICLNVLAFVVDSVPWVRATYGNYFIAFEIFSVAVFTIEYVLRLWACVELPFLSHMPPWRARSQFASRPMQVVDLLAFLPAYVEPFLPIDLSFLRILRLFRFLKIARYSAALQSLGRVIAAERGALFGAFIIMVCLLLLAATGMHFIEGSVQPKHFGTIPDSLWWALITLTTVGYGDVVPLTLLGKVFTGLMLLCGLAVFALPIGIIATGFSQEVTRRDFIVTWSLVARVPVFAGFDAAAVAQIMTLLYSRTYEGGSVIVRVGEPGNSMFFLASGEVLVEADEGEVRLGEGEFFGELALLEGRPRTHTVTAATRCRLLILDREDFERLARRHPVILQRVREVASRRRHDPAKDAAGGPSAE
ncbi:MAG: ion transporter [Hyphomicrobiaceae bacterium]|nr:ion transporter [Hyphomicrobiaceae bacterium]